MRPTKINLTALRERRLPGFPLLCESSYLRAGSYNSFRVSRRQFLGMAGVATIGAHPFATMANPAPDRVELLEGANGIAFKYRGLERWVIDTRLFGGRPQLKLHNDTDHIRIILTNAVYPGTNIPADLVCDLQSRQAGWHMKLNLNLGGFTAEEIPFEDWLLGRDQAQSAVRLEQHICSLGTCANLTASGQMSSSFGPDWTLRFFGEDAVKVSVPGGEVLSDATSISLLKPGDPTLVNDPGVKRSLITVSRGGQDWSLDPLLGSSSNWQFRSPDNIFDTVHVEAGEAKGGAVRYTLFATSSEPNTVYFSPAHEIKGKTGEPFQLGLRNVRYAVTVDKAGEQRALIAEVSIDPVWLYVGECGLLIGGGDDTRFELVQDEEHATQLRCSLSLYQVVAPLDGGVARPIITLEGAGLTFVDGPKEQGAEVSLGAKLYIDRKSEQAWVEVPIVGVEALRPEDLVMLRFDFTNLLLRAITVKKRILFVFPTEKQKGVELIRLDAKKPVYISVNFPQQHIAEQAFFEADPHFPGQSERLPPPPVRARISGGSRLAFRVPENIRTIPYSLESLLDWTQFEQSVVATAIPAGETTSENLTQPDPIQTAIEFPYRLILSPNRFAAWAHERRPKVEKSGAVPDPGQDPGGTGDSVSWVELWHTRLAVRAEGGVVDEQSELHRKLRAVWTPDQRGGNTLPSFCEPKQKSADPNNPNFRKSVDENDRYEIVRLSSDFNIKPNTADTIREYVPAPISVKRFMMTSLGAWADIEGAWGDRPASSGLSLREWRHHATMARDNYVRVVYGGYLYPYGHRASLTQVTERKFRRPSDGGPITAYLQQRVFITVEEPIKEYGNTGLFTLDAESIDRMIPYRSLEITTLVTPNIDDPETGPCSIRGKCAFWPCVGGQKFLFHMIGEDHGGQRSEMSAPAIFIVYAAAHSTDPTVRRAAAQAFNAQQAGRLQLNGQRVAFVPPTQPGDTTYETHILNFSGRLPEEVTPSSTISSSGTLDAPAAHASRAAESGNRNAGTALALVPADMPESCREPLPSPWHPVVEIAEVVIPAVAAIMGVGAVITALPIVWHETYLTKGFDPNVTRPNVGEVFARLRNEIPLSLPNSRSVGLVKPDFDISGLSRRFGTVSGKIEQVGGATVDKLKELAEGNFDPANYFKEGLSEAKLMGFIKLKDIIEKVLGFDFDSEGLKIPNVKTRTLYDQNQLPEIIESRMQWRPDLREWQSNFVSLTKLPEASLTLEVILHTRLRGGGVTHELLGELRDIRVEIVKAIIIDFSKVSFGAKSGQKPQVDVDIGDVRFRNELEFVSELQKGLSANPFGENGPSIQITPSSITASVGFTLPDVAVGAFSLMNIRLSARLYLPLAGNTPVRLRFAFGERHDPFLVAVTFLGGGGFLAISLGVDGIEAVEGALEFGGIVAISIASLAEGNVYALGGIYFLYERVPGVTLTGYMRCGGALVVLGLVTVSVEHFLGLTYKPETGCVEGEATVTVRISILFFSKSVKLTLKRQFAGSRGACDPTLVASLSGPALPDRPKPPKFKDLMWQTDWNTYCDAFAADVWVGDFVCSSE